MSDKVMVDEEALREQVRVKYREVATHPYQTYHFHTGRPLAARLGYDTAVVDALPDVAVESFAGVANPSSLQPLARGERVVDVGSGGGFDSFIAVSQIGSEGQVGWHRYDRGDARKVTLNGKAPGSQECRISRGIRGESTRRRQLGGCGHQQRCHQSMR